MKEIITKVKSHWKLMVGIIIVIGLVLVLAGNKKEELKIVKVIKGDLSQVVSVTGITKSLKTAELAFDRGGRIGAVYAKEGERVTEGKTLIELESGELFADVREKEARLAAERAELEELLRGTRKEELEIAEYKVVSAENTLRQSEQEILESVQDAYVKSDDAVRSRMDQFFLNPRTNPSVTFYVRDSQIRLDLEGGRLSIEKMLLEWGNALDKELMTTNSASLALQSLKYITDVKSLLEKAVLAINDSRPDQNVSQASLDAWKATLSTGRANVSSAQGALQSALDARQVSERAVELAKKELTLKLAGARKEQVDAKKAAVLEAEARRDSSIAQLRKASIRAPFSGMITKQDGKVGEIAIAGTPLVSLISTNGLEIEASIPEVDSVRVKIGNPVSIVFDALPEDVFKGRLGFIDPAETVKNGVTNFKVKVYFESADERLKSGLTTNLDIETTRLQNVLKVPKFALIEKEGSWYASKKLVDGYEEVKVEIGLLGSDGMLEIKSGLSEGDELVYSK